MATADGHTRVYAAFAVEVPGSGTTPGHRSLEVVGADTAAREPVWHAVVPVEAWADKSYRRLTAAPVWTDGHTLITRLLDKDSLSNEGESTTYAFDLASGKVAWKQVGFAAQVVASSVVIGIEYDHDKYRTVVVGRSVEDGSTRWTQPQETYVTVALYPAGPHFVHAILDNAGQDDSMKIIDVATGATKETLVGAFNGVACAYDGRSVTVCFKRDPGNTWTGAYDATSGSYLWSLPDEDANRVAPTVTTAWHGAVYGKTENGPVILDARTGKDRAAAAGAAPYLVDAQAGIAVDPQSGSLTAVPADR
ncbi:hypothetical protein [Frankia sp. AiPa1]|uniref:hypothetical protein n=1 Tax=Frankia sp. AiPa1 TaxID=573492 RepID=UPI00202AC3F1|nr:hypothetical protein [Frankia sp. AiPa1]MCL9761307.1 hypothetical protein [Frankia sp. AiPa1]